MTGEQTAGTDATSIAADQLRSIVERVLRMKEEADQIAKDIRDIYAEAKSSGFNKTAIGLIVAETRKRDKDSEAYDETQAIVDLYRDALSGHVAAPVPSRRHTREAVSQTAQAIDHDPETGEVYEPNPPETAPEVLGDRAMDAATERSALQVDPQGSAETGVEGQPSLIPVTSATSASNAGSQGVTLAVSEQTVANSQSRAKAGDEATRVAEAKRASASVRTTAEAPEKAEPASRDDEAAEPGRHSKSGKAQDCLPAGNDTPLRGREPAPSISFPPDHPVRVRDGNGSRFIRYDEFLANKAAAEAGRVAR